MLARLAFYWRQKLTVSCLVTGGFAAGYLFLEHHPLFPVTQMPVTWIDQRIPFRPGFVYLYESLWLIMPISPWLMETVDDFNRYVRSLLLIIAIGFGFFLLFPTSSPRPAASHDANALYQTLVRIDNDGNAFPSLHAALAVLSMACSRLPLRDARQGRWLFLLLCVWASGIVASTLLTKQHVVMDAVAGVVLGFAGYAAIHLRKGRPSDE